MNADELATRTGSSRHVARLGWGGQDVWAVGGLLLIAVVLPLLVGAVAGSLDIPRNDDWSYRRIAVEFARTGRLVLDGASQTMLVGQLVVALPFLWLSGLESWAFIVIGVIFATGLTITAYVLARCLLPPRLAVIPALSLALFPGYLAYATSFMTDVPAMAALFACLALGMVALERRPVPIGWLVASVVVGFYAFSIRDFAVAAPASVLVAAILAEPRRARPWLVGAVIACCCVGLYVWRATLPGQLGDVVPRQDLTDGLSIASVAFVALPAAIVGAARWRGHWRWSDVTVGALVGLILVGIVLIEWDGKPTFPQVLLENLTSQWGVPAQGYLIGGRPILIPDPAWTAVNLLALGSTVLVLAIGAGVAGAHIRRCGLSISRLGRCLASAPAILLLFVVAIVIGLTAFGLRWLIFDRYFWPIIPPLATLFLYVPADLLAQRSGATSRSRALVAPVSAGLFAAVLVAMSVMYLANSHAFDVARWRGGQRLLELGIPAARIDAGYEWVGFHSTTLAKAASPTPAVIWYRGWWPTFQPCGVVSSVAQDVPGARLEGTIKYDLHLLAGPIETLYLYRINSPDCPSK
jgi:hypothetical protein